MVAATLMGFSAKDVKRELSAYLRLSLATLFAGTHRSFFVHRRRRAQEKTVALRARQTAFLVCEVIRAPWNIIGNQIPTGAVLAWGLWYRQGSQG